MSVLVCWYVLSVLVNIGAHVVCCFILSVVLTGCTLCLASLCQVRDGLPGMGIKACLWVPPCQLHCHISPGVYWTQLS